MDELALETLKENAFWQLCFDQINDRIGPFSFCTECDDDDGPGSEGEEDDDD